MCPAFEQIGRKLGPFDLSFIPIWRGGSLGFISYMGLRLLHNDVPATLHCSPTDAVAIHQDVKSRNTVGIHFGTFGGSENETYEAMIEFGEACDDRGVPSLDDRVEGKQGRAGTLDIGGSLAVEVG
jgi:L-ascorbate metabolism protein UlaG (beta-lactamase superfamily)